MPRMVDLDQLVDVGMIADRAGVTPPAVSNWRSRYAEFPQPVWTGTGDRSDLFLWWQVEAWLRHTGRI